MVMLSLTSMSQNKPKTFLDKYEDIALKLMNEHNIPASVILGVSMLESGYGTSNLSQTKNNYFGVRLPGKTQYRFYETDTASFVHFCSVIKRDRYNYDKLVEEQVTDYKIWLENIKNGGYAESEYWKPRISSIIKQYELYKLDEELDNKYKLSCK